MLWRYCSQPYVARLWQKCHPYPMVCAMNSALDTLFYPFTQDLLAKPAGRTLFINAESHSVLSGMNADCFQYFYPAVQGLTLADDVMAPYGAALVLVSKDKTAAQYELAQAFEALEKNGFLMAAAANDANGNRLESWFADMGLAVQSASKNKARVVWAVKGDEAITPFEWLLRGALQHVDIEGDVYWSQPGLFGWDKVDTGSALLAKRLPPDLKGNGADFGCGYGYLTRQILAAHKLSSFTAIDADKRAVDCCVKNNPDAKGVWTDLTQPWKEDPFDWIVMNPPFHLGKMTDSDIGAAFIRTAAGALKKGGHLYMVANRQLPYEEILVKHFAKMEIVEQAQGFKIIFAQK